jgi:hypothetical protein
MDAIICNMAVCVCCMLVHANGECCADDSHGGDSREPWSEVNFADGYSVTMGLLAEEHGDTCTETDREEGCDCEGPWFSWSRCNGCGSRLGGNRYAFTLWRKLSVAV